MFVFGLKYAKHRFSWMEFLNSEIPFRMCWSTYIHKRPNIGNALRGLLTGTQSEKDGSNNNK